MAMPQFTEQSPHYYRRSIWLPPAERQVPGSPYAQNGQPGEASGHLRSVPGRHSRRSPSAAPGRGGTTAQAVIGDLLREVAAWCELSPCIARYTESGALGEADIAGRAIAAGWCKDAFGRLICPACQQRIPIWSAAPLVPRVTGQLRY
jgi:hypothetical protein